MLNDPRLAEGTRAFIGEATDVAISAVSLHEIGQKVRLGKWPEMEAMAPNLVERAIEDDLRIVPVTPRIALDASLLEWDHRDPFDRIIWVTARLEDLRIVSSDAAFETMGESARVWH